MGTNGKGHLKVLSLKTQHTRPHQSGQLRSASSMVRSPNDQVSLRLVPTIWSEHGRVVHPLSTIRVGDEKGHFLRTGSLADVLDMPNVPKVSKEK